LALWAGEALSSLELSTLFVLLVAEVHGVPWDEIERRRTLVMGILLGQSGSATIGKIAERTGQHWGRQVVSKVPLATLRQINSVLGSGDDRRPVHVGRGRPRCAGRRPPSGARVRPRRAGRRGVPAGLRHGDGARPVDR
jgi:hypothetical protein